MGLYLSKFGVGQSIQLLRISGSLGRPKNSSAADCHILLKFGMFVQYGSAEAAK